MLSRAEFNIWFQDFRCRFPAVGTYAASQGVPERLLDTWHQQAAAFDPDVLQGVTDGIISGTIEPVPNTQLGQFGSEIRQRCRQVLESRRRADEPTWKTTGTRTSQDVLSEPRMMQMLAAGMAAYRLTGTFGESYEAAIAMADDHSQAEADRCHAEFSEDGTSWDAIRQEAGL